MYQHGPAIRTECDNAIRTWVAERRLMAKTAEPLIKEGFRSMEALQLVDSDDLTHTKIPRGQQKLGHLGRGEAMGHGRGEAGARPW